MRYPSAAQIAEQDQRRGAGGAAEGVAGNQGDVAAITALGLACWKDSTARRSIDRAASRERAIFGQPEVGTGILPGGGATERTIDALDFYGTWKLFDGLTDAAFYGKNGNYALGDTKEQRFMGGWSDGAPVKELIVTAHP